MWVCWSLLLESVLSRRFLVSSLRVLKGSENGDSPMFRQFGGVAPADILKHDPRPR
jgi:hypothetical protein